MSPRSTARTGSCNHDDVVVRLRHADSFLVVADLVLDQPDDPNLALTSVAASLTVLAGIAAADAATCVAIGRRSRGQNHADAVSLVKTITPGGEAMAKDLDRLIDLKDDAQYGMILISHERAKSSVTWARRLVDAAHAVVGRAP